MHLSRSPTEPLSITLYIVFEWKVWVQVYHSCCIRSVTKELYLDLRTRFNLKFFGYSQKIDIPERFIVPFLTGTVRLFLLEGLKPPHDHKIIKLLTFETFYPPLRHSRYTARVRMTTTITFSRQNDAGSCARTT